MQRDDVLVPSQPIRRPSHRLVRRPRSFVRVNVYSVGYSVVLLTQVRLRCESHASTGTSDGHTAQ